MKAGHTSGPWLVKRPDVQGSCDIESESGDLIGNVFAQHSRNSMRGFTPEVAITQANARLIAVAPDLLAALEACDEAFVSWQVGQIPGRPEDILALINQVRVALARAMEGAQ